MISATGIVVLAALAGWLVGLTAHAFRVVRWKDPGARALWATTAGLGVGAILLSSLALCLLTHGPGFLLVIAAGVIVGSIGAWHASDALGSADAGGGRTSARRRCKSGNCTAPGARAWKYLRALQRKGRELFAGLTMD